ncbi:MAG: PAS domain S-box protein [Theionarchaea archaeon]|nr:PAS domain S-box protein [Theionarchaea archaeon]
MTVANCNDEKREREGCIYISLTTVLTAIQNVVDPEEVYQTLGETLATQGLHNIVLECPEETMKIIWLSLPSPLEESIEELQGTPLLKREFSVEHIPHCERIKKGEIVFCSSEQVFPPILGVSQKLLESVLPAYAMLVPILDHWLLLVASDDLTAEDCAAFSVFREALETTISLADQVKKSREQKEFWEHIVKNVQEGILMEDAEGMITFVNSTLLEMLGYTRQELIGKHYSKIASPESVKLAEEETKKRPQGMQSQYEACLLCKDETLIPVIVSATPLFKQGTYTGTLTVFTNISSQKEAEKKIQALKEFSENIIQSMHEGIIIEDAKGVITFVNPRIEEILERKKEDIIGHHWQEFIAPEYVPKVREESARRVHGIAGQYETALLTKRGREVPLMVGATPFFENGQFKGTISVCVDLTVIKEKEKEIKEKNEDLQLLSRINHALNKGEDLDTILNIAVQEVQNIFDSDFVAIMFCEREEQHISCRNFALYPDVHQMNIDPEVLQKFSFPLGEGTVVEKTVQKKQGCLVQDSSLEQIFKGMLDSKVASEIQQHTKVTSAIVLPLLAESEVVGIMVIGSQAGLNQQDMSRLRSLSKHLAFAVDHAQLDETFQQTSRELQTSLSEQILLRELMEKLYMAESQKEVVDIAAEGLKQLGHQVFGVALKEPETQWVMLLQAHPPDILKRVATVIEDITGEVPQLDRIPLPEEEVYVGTQKRRIALVTDNITLREEKNVISLPLTALIQAWVGPDTAVKEKVSQAMGLRSAICVPFHVEREVAGAFVAGSATVLTHHDFVILETLGQLIGESLERLQYSETLLRKSRDLEFTNRQLSLLQEISNALNSTMDLEEILKVLVKGISSVFGYDTPSIYLLSEDRKHLLVKEFDISSRLLSGITRLVGFSIKNYRIPLFEKSQLKRVIDEGEPLITDDIPKLLKDFTDKESLRKLAGALYRLASAKWVTALPLIAGEKPVGMLIFGSTEKIEEKDIQALGGFLNQAALAIAKARLYEEVKEANQMKSEFIDLAGHELRTPLTSIKLYLEMIKMGRYGELSGELEEKIGMLQAIAGRLQEIIDKTLVSSRIHKEELKPKKEEISLVRLINDVVAQLRPMWDGKAQKIDVQGPYQLPLIKADRDGMWEVINALLDNAIKYSPEESKITVKIYDHPKEVEVAVMDEGIGIQKEYQEKIFKDFYIIPSETEYARMDGRTGLGLFIAKGIVAEHGGEIWVESVYGLGSTFHFTIPK